MLNQSQKGFFSDSLKDSIGQAVIGHLIKNPTIDNEGIGGILTEVYKAAMIEMMENITMLGASFT